jgi:hypothetical protein
VDKRLEQFLDLSAVLTGFSRVQLLGTGMTEEYLRALDAILPASVVDELLTAYIELPEGSEREEAIATQVLGDPKLGPVARNVIVLWYCGSWTVLPDEWRYAYGASSLDKTRVLSAESYQAALQWVTVGAHTPGSANQGFASWAAAPERSLP